MHRTAFCLAIVGLIFFIGFPAFAEDGKWDTIGVRAGIGDDRNNESFSQYEAYATFSLPWRWVTESQWTIGSFVGVNAGVLTCEGEAFVGSIGPGAYLMSPGKRFVFSAGIYPTYISEATFGDDDFGETFQFTSAVGVNYNFLRSMTIGYRFQHMSNAGISSENPGLNMHMIELGYRF